MHLARGGQAFYSGDPSTSSKDWVRFTIGDVDRTDWQLSDEEIIAILADQGGVKILAAAAACEHLANRYSRDATKSISAGGGLSQSITPIRSREYAARAKELRQRYEDDLSRTGGWVFAGGIRQGDKDVLIDDADATQPAFRDGMFDA